MEWQNYVELNGANGYTVGGNLQVLKNLYSPRLANQRDLLVYLPHSYDTSGKRYPVLYMHDGQNLFDPATSFA